MSGLTWAAGFYWATVGRAGVAVCADRCDGRCCGKEREWALTSAGRVVCSGIWTAVAVGDILDTGSCDGGTGGGTWIAVQGMCIE